MRLDLSRPIRGRVWKFGDSVDTDIIAPNKRAPVYDELKKITMDAVRPEFAKEVQPGDVLVAGKNFGCGSHREGANSVLRDVGIQAIVAESIARIFFRIGISFAMPTFIVPGVSALVEDGDQIEIDYAAGEVRNVGTGKTVSFAKYPEPIEKIFKAGGIMSLAIERYKNEQS